MADRRYSRREFCAAGGAVVVGANALARTPTPEANAFALNYILGSSMYGGLKLADIAGEVRKTGAEYIDIWPKKHGTQREQMETMGHEAVAALLKKHKVKLGILTHYDLGPYRLHQDMPTAAKFGAKMLISAGMPKTKAAVKPFFEKIKPQLAAAEKAGVVIGIENHGESYDAIRRFADGARSKRIGVALAPYHLKPETPEAISKLITDLGDKLVHFYAWQHGMGCMKKLPKAQELLQMPGRGPLDFVPILAALKRIRYAGWTEIFMHPVPRGIPILPTLDRTTAEINRARDYLTRCLARI